MGLTSFFKNFFGSAKETADDFAGKAENTLEEVKEAVEPFIDKAEIFAEEAIEKIKEAADSIGDAIESLTSEITDDNLVTESVVDVSEKAITADDSDK
ncbi:hypothetical protein [Flavobacterium johnsoniae]|jgi:hypothetical protein|uniref:YtxH domain-containing protein n=1 Tax=Flavobacterium johnsoniae TaxID=986 RepID=A0A1J7C839_FLAJO|nr:hypothetical protein [Flavobacterium johnsoniae]OIV41865.1 hypothetical protein BKM63_09370 [Flavobacterium johnsoniae]